MINIVTIEREYGSGGGEIAQSLATQLGWKLWDQLLTEEIARLANCPKAVVEVREERTDPLYYRLFKSFLRGSYEGSLNAHKLKVVDTVDRERKDFIQKYFGVQWPDREVYHGMINTGIGDQPVVNTIRNFIK